MGNNSDVKKKKNRRGDPPVQRGFFRYGSSIPVLGPEQARVSQSCNSRLLVDTPFALNVNAATWADGSRFTKPPVGFMAISPVRLAMLAKLQLSLA
jgi:hypothetical protein